MLELKFDEEKCFACDTYACLTKCQHMDIGMDVAKTEMERIINGEESFVLHDCATCYSCNEYCQNGNYPFYFIVQQQEQLGIPPLPDPLVKRGINMGIPFRGEPEIDKITGTALNMCVFSALTPRVQGKLFENTTLMSHDNRKMFHYFCQLMYLHYGTISTINDRLGPIMDTIASHKADEVVHFHDECYATYTDYAPAYGMEVPFKSVHLFEFLHNRLLELKDQIKPLGYKVTYQRNCSSRLISDTHQWVSKIFELIGVDEVEREFTGENGMCCGGPMLSLKKEGSRQYTTEIQTANIEDMKQAGAQLCVFNCPACIQVLGKPVSEAGIMPLFMSDLCRLAVGEKV